MTATKNMHLLTHDQRCDLLIELYIEQYHAVQAVSNRQPGADADRAIRLGDELRASANGFRKDFYPTRHRVVVTDSGIYTVSKTGRSTQQIFDPNPSMRAVSHTQPELF